MGSVKNVSMTLKEAENIINNEVECVITADKGCDRECEFCKLVRPTENILTAYEIALVGIKQLIEELSPSYEVDAGVIKGSRARIQQKHYEHKQ